MKGLFGWDVSDPKRKAAEPQEPVRRRCDRQLVLFDAGHGDLPGQLYLFCEFETEGSENVGTKPKRG